MKINNYHYKYTVRTEYQIRRNIRNMVKRAMSDAGKTYTLTLENVAKTREVSVKIVQEGDTVKFALPDKDVYSKREVYPLLKDALQFR